MTFEFPAPAKVNRRLRIVGRRADGMHLLESDAALLEFGDAVKITPRRDGQIRRAWAHSEVADDLCARAALALRTESGAAHSGADIAVEKRVPIGGGLGGASSDAATVLLGLNRLWDLRFSRARLTALGAKLGADIPFFLSGLGAARVAGIGEKVSAANDSEGDERRGTGGTGGRSWIVLAHPGVSAGTAEVYGAYDSGAEAAGLTSGLKSAIIALSRWNDLAAAACFLRPQIAECARDLERAAGTKEAARMTGGGSCVFAEVGDAAEAERIRGAMAGMGWESWTTRILDSHPMRDFAG